MNHWATDTAFLAATNFLTGIIGFFYRLFLSKYLGSGGMGIYQQTLAFFSTAITIITAGIPVSVSKLVAENHQENFSRSGSIVTSAFALTTIFSLFGIIFLISLSQVLHLRVLTHYTACFNICRIFFSHEGIFFWRSAYCTYTMVQSF